VTSPECHFGFALTDSEFCWQDPHGDKAVCTELTNRNSLAGTRASPAERCLPTQEGRERWRRVYPPAAIPC
jgi:hypothetical protein